MPTNPYEPPTITSEARSAPILNARFWLGWLAIFLLPTWLVIGDALVAHAAGDHVLPGNLIYLALLVVPIGCGALMTLAPISWLARFGLFAATFVLLFVQVLVIGIISLMLTGLSGTQ